MASEADSSSILSGAGTRSTAAGVIARQDRIPIWSLSYLFIGIGADLALVNTYINEMAPISGRARYTSLIFIMSALGAFIGI